MVKVLAIISLYSLPPASANPLLFVVALGLIMAWKIAGYFGMDYFLLPIIGTPWGWAGKVRQTRSVTETIKA